VCSNLIRLVDTESTYNEIISDRIGPDELDA
jgi:hypothetical protein